MSPAIFLLVFGTTLITTTVDRIAAQDTADDQQIPSATEVIGDYIEALGGEMALSAAETMYLRGDIVNSTGRISWNGFESRWKGNRWTTTYLQDGVDLTIGSVDGKVWRQWEGNEANWEDETNDLYNSIGDKGPGAVLRWEDKFNFDDIEVVAAEVNGRPVWQLEFPLPGRHTILRSFDIESGLLVKSEYDINTVHMVTHFDDFRDVDGVMFAFHESTEYLNHEIEYDIEVVDLRLNDDIDDSLIDPPASLKEED